MKYLEDFLKAQAATQRLGFFVSTNHSLPVSLAPQRRVKRHVKGVQTMNPIFMRGAKQPSLVETNNKNHGCTQMNTDTKALSVSIRVHLWLKFNHQKFGGSSIGRTWPC